MKVLIARMSHETNTFSPVPTPLAAFGNDGPLYGDAAYQRNKGKRTAMSAFIDLAEQHGADIVTPIDASANPSGRVHADAYQSICDHIVEAAADCDAILLDLHGAMATHNTDDGEGDLLERVRAAAPNAPIAVALDLHGNVTPKMIANADVIVGFKTYPHVDMYETGERAGRLLFDKLSGRSRPVMAWRLLPLITHTLRSTTESGAMQATIEAARQAENDATLAVSILPGFGLADIPYPCMSVIVVAEGDQAHAEQVATRFAEKLWKERDGFCYEIEPLEQSLAHALDLARNADKPVLLLDHGDNCMSGGSCDTMDVLQAALDAGLEGILAGLYCDPEAVAQMNDAGVDATITLQVGNKRAIPQIGRDVPPLFLHGTIKALTDGEYTITGPTYTGQRAYMGRSAVLDIGQAQLVITERPHEPWDLGVFESLGLAPRQAQYLLLKSRMYCRPVFVPISSGLVECNSPGVTSSDWSLFNFERRVRPLYPLEHMPADSYDPTQASPGTI